MKILLTEWAARHYSPAPSAWTLRKMARNGEFWPAPERIGKCWYIDENARRQTAVRATLVERAPVEPTPIRKPRDISLLDQSLYVYSLKDAQAACREFCDPRGVGCGVYLVLSDDKTKCLYVGSSAQLSNRLRNGWHAPPAQPTFSFEVPEPIVRDVEATYYRALNPPVNAKSPNGQPCEKAIEQIRELWA